jgi:hypothetical protein
MARTLEGAALTRAHSARQLALRATTLRDLLALWGTVDATDLSSSIHVFVRAAVVLARARNQDSAGLAANYYRLFRTAEGIPGTAVARLAAAPTVEQIAAEVRGASLAGIVNARRAGASAEVATRHGFVRAAGAVTKLVLSGGRMTLLRSVEADPRTIGWGRVTSGDPCAFCRMLAGRGPAYGSKRSADFEAHDSCACTAEPSYEGSEPSAQAVQYQREWKAAQAQAAKERAEGVERASTTNDALNAYRRYLSGGEQTT